MHEFPETQTFRGGVPYCQFRFAVAASRRTGTGKGPLVAKRITCIPGLQKFKPQMNLCLSLHCSSSTCAQITLVRGTSVFHFHQKYSLCKLELSLCPHILTTVQMRCAAKFTSQIHQAILNLPCRLKSNSASTPARFLPSRMSRATYTPAFHS